MCNRVSNQPTPTPTPVNTEAQPASGANTTAGPNQVTTTPAETAVGNTTNNSQFTVEYMRVTYSQNGQGGAQCTTPWSPTNCMPAPGSENGLSGAPAGQGLTKNSDGSVTTAGGYKIVPENKENAWSVYDKDGKQLTRVWGDPHVSEGDGTRWDFTKGSNFVLPDGTRISAKTTADTGHPVTSGLDIANGSDRIQISGIDQNAPVTGEPTRDGLAGWQTANGVGKDTYALKHDGTNQDWVKYGANGALQGVVTGAKDDGTGSYAQETTGADSALAQTPVANQNGMTGPGQGFGLEQLWQALSGLFGGGQQQSPDPFQQMGQNGMTGLPQNGMQNGMDQQMNPMGFIQMLQQLFGGGAFGGLGQNGMSPQDGYGAVQQLQAVLYQAAIAQQMQSAQLFNGFYNRSFSGR